MTNVVSFPAPSRIILRIGHDLDKRGHKGPPKLFLFLAEPDGSEDIVWDGDDPREALRVVQTDYVSQGVRFVDETGARA